MTTRCSRPRVPQTHPTPTDPTPTGRTRNALGALALALLGAGCLDKTPAEVRGVDVSIAALSLPRLSNVCYDLRLTNEAAGAGEVVWQRGTPGLNGGAGDSGAICADRFGAGGDITYVGPCDASPAQGDPPGQRTNSLTVWFDGLYDDLGAYMPPDGPNGWRDPCPGGCTLDVICRENADTPVRFDFTVMRNARQGFFDVAVSFEDIFCSAKLDTCYEGDEKIELLFGADDRRDWTAAFGFACSAGTNAARTTLEYGDLAVVCGSGPSAIGFPLNPVGGAGNNWVTTGDKTLHYGVYRGAEDLACDVPGTPAVESCRKVYWNLALSLDDLAGLGTCVLAFAATATDGDRGFAQGLPVGGGVTWPYIEVAATLTPATCQRNALDDGGAVRTAYRGNLQGVPQPPVMCSAFDGTTAGPIAGADCSDGCPNDPDKTRPGLCGCGVADTDGDSDGVPDCNDGCPLDATKTAPGSCGCGVNETDSDGDTTPDCDDLCVSDPNKVAAGLCGCGVADTDSDSDGTPDCNDLCPNDPNKVTAGLCGCGVADTDSDSDGTPDCNDLCPNDPNKLTAGLCGCGVADTDSDNDGTPDCDDLCVSDPNKVAAGLCGCGVADTDSDSDGTPDCEDLCVSDPNKVTAGVCGCGTADTDSDNDGTPNCNDACPNDPSKLTAGLCGCGVADTDSDNDGTPNCNDACPNDPNKLTAGLCGCGVADIDSDSDGTPDCNDACPNDPNKVVVGTCGCGVTDTASLRLGGTISNAASSCVAILDAGVACGDTTYWIDTTGGDTSDAFQAFCDMTTGGGGWMKVESATYPFWFTASTWDSHNPGSPTANNYSILSRRANLVDVNGCYEYRVRMGDGSGWQSPFAKETLWRQCHDPFTASTDGSDYTFIAGQAPVTCGGFNGLHNKYVSHSYTSDPDLNDAVNCWWMQIVPHTQYESAANYPGYLHGYFLNAPRYYPWQSLWMRSAGLGKGRDSPGLTCDALHTAGVDEDGVYWIDPNGGNNADAFLAYCDMTATAGWTRVEGATYPFFFTSANWQSLAIGTPAATNFSMLTRRALFASGGCTTWRFTVGDTGTYTSAPAQETRWRQCHDPFTSSTAGADYTFIGGTAPTTCGGFNGLHNKYQGFSYATDADQDDNINCWAMQAVPHSYYTGHPGYYDGYGGDSAHQWQALWVK